MIVKPIVVTGMPRSGTTWLARELARSPGTALTGREPMNPRGRQYALGGTLTGWTKLSGPTPRQVRMLSRAYRGTNPLVYSRYGHNQWKAPFPWTRVIVKDPFAMLSIPTIGAVTGARTIVVFRHPAAVLASFRRMGWAPDPQELRQLEELTGRTHDENLGVADDLVLVGRMWSLLYSVMLSDLDDAPDAVILSHESVARGGDQAMRRVFAHVGLRPVKMAGASRARSTMRVREGTEERRLHNFDRDPRVVADAWRASISTAELEVLDSMTSDTMSALRRVEFHVG